MLQVEDQQSLHASEHNRLQHIHSSMKVPMDDHAEKLVYQMNKGYEFFKYGLCRLHKHFEIFSDECVVTRFQDGKYITTVKKYESGKYTPWQWKYCSEKSQWIPVEFLETTESKIDTNDVQVVGEALM